MKKTSFTLIDHPGRMAIHDVLFQLGILSLDAEQVEVKKYYYMLPKEIKSLGETYGFDDSEVRGEMYEWFENNVKNERL